MRSKTKFRIGWKAGRLETCQSGLGLGSGCNSLAYNHDNDGFRATIGGLKECSIEFDMLYLAGDPGFEAIKTAWLTSDQIHLAALTGKGGEGPVGDFFDHRLPAVGTARRSDQVQCDRQAFSMGNVERRHIRHNCVTFYQTLADLSSH